MEAGGAVEVWELQRRTTLFHRAWRAPFLPHDGQKRWRWVDGAYRRHPLAPDVSLQESAEADSPILLPPPGRGPPRGGAGIGAWAVVRDEARGACDEEGWQYAVDFYEGDRWWQRDPKLCHCRRRLWRCSLGEEPSGVAPRRYSMPADSPVATSIEELLDEAPRRASLPAASLAATSIEEPLDVAPRRSSLPAASLAAASIEEFLDEAQRRSSLPVASPVATSIEEPLDEAPRRSSLPAASPAATSIEELLDEAPRRSSLTAASPLATSIEEPLDEASRHASLPAASPAATSLEELLDEAPRRSSLPAASPLATSIGEPLDEAPRRASLPAASPTATSIEEPLDEASRRASTPDVTLESFLGEELLDKAPRRSSLPAALPVATSIIEEPLNEAPRRSSLSDASLEARIMTRALEEELVPVAAPSSMSLASEAESMFAPEWDPGSLLVDFLEAQGATDIRVGPWLQGPGEGDRRAGVREVQMLQPVPPAPMAPRTTRATVRYHIWLEGGGPGARLCWEAVIATLDTPFCDCYTILDRVVLSPADGGITVKKEFCVRYSKRTFARSIIESSAKAVQKQIAQVLMEVLRRRAGVAGAADQTDLQPAPCHEEDPSIAEVWELQRRKTLFHDTWQAPFLPHDGQKQWRWVDRRYRRHPWAAEGSRQASAKSSTPPLGPPGGGDDARWVLAEAQGPSDPAGWQYAVDFYSGDARWGSSSTMYHCRRRLWRLQRTAASSERAAPVRSTAAEGRTEGGAATTAPARRTAPLLAVFVCAAVVAAAFGVGFLGRVVLVACALAVLCDRCADLASSRRLFHSAACWANTAVLPKVAVED